MLETITWIRFDKSKSRIEVEVKEDRSGIEFVTGSAIGVDHLIRRAGRTYQVYEVIGLDENRSGPFTIKCEPQSKEAIR